MWFFTTFGFFSVTESDNGLLQVRARVKEDLDELRNKYIPQLSETISLPGRDYPYRGYATKQEVAAGFAQAILDIDYSNFKDTVLKRQGLNRELLYSQVWSVMYGAEHKVGRETEYGAMQPFFPNGHLLFDIDQQSSKHEAEPEELYEVSTSEEKDNRGLRRGERKTKNRIRGRRSGGGRG